LLVALRSCAPAATPSTAPSAATTGAITTRSLVRLGHRGECRLRRRAFHFVPERDLVLPIVEPGQRDQAAARCLNYELAEA
jgi:hypothetical protein